jgi:hypothetical protein
MSNANSAILSYPAATPEQTRDYMLHKLSFHLRFYDRSGARRLSKQRYTLPLAAVVGGASA